jgi:hypothetical protein
MDQTEAVEAVGGPRDDTGVIETLVGLVETGPLALGTFTTAQILAVNGPAPGLPVPEPAVLAEAVVILLPGGSRSRSRTATR